MEEKKEYKVGEIFRHEGFTYQCVIDSRENGYCGKCQLCDAEILCDKEERADNTGVHFIRVTEPEYGMLFRAWDGVLYEAREKEPEDKCCYCCIRPVYGCTEIGRQAFGKLVGRNIHWYQKEEKVARIEDHSFCDTGKVLKKARGEE